jgi:hypothetical protein
MFAASLYTHKERQSCHQERCNAATCQHAVLAKPTSHTTQEQTQTAMQQKYYSVSSYGLACVGSGIHK